MAVPIDQNVIDDLKQRLRKVHRVSKFPERHIEIIAIVSEALKPYDIRPILVGGAAVEFYTRGGYTTGDIDLVAPGGRELADTCIKNGIDRVFMGDWHNPDKWCKKDANFEAHQISTLIPASFSDAYRNVGRIAIFDTVTRGTTFITVPGPRFLKVDDIDKAVKQHRHDMENATVLYVQMSCLPDDYDARKGQFLTSVAIAGIRCTDNIRFVPKYNTAEAEMKAEMACNAAKSAKSISEATRIWLIGQDVTPELSQLVQHRIADLIRKVGGDATRA